MRRFSTKRVIIAVAAILTGLSVVVYFEKKPRLVPGQQPLADIENIDTLRRQFSLDAGKTRLIILVSPT